MSGLIKIAFRVRIRSALFLALCGAVLLTGLAVSMEFRNGVYHLNRIPFSAACAASIVSTVFGAGVEFADGTVRSKLVCGKTKLKIYLSQLIASLCVSLIFFVLAAVPYFLIGRSSFFSRFDSEILVRAAALLLAGEVFLTVIAVLITLLVKNRAAALIVCMGVVMLLLLAEKEISRSLIRPEYTKVTYIFEDPSQNYEEIILNDKYVSKPARTVLYTALKLNPFQCFLSARDIVRYDGDDEGDVNRTSLKAIEAECDHVKNSDQKYLWDAEYFRDKLINNIYYPLWSGSLVLVLTAAGIVIFRKRNIY